MTNTDTIIQLLNATFNVNDQRNYRPRTMKVFFTIGLVFFISQGCQQPGLSLSQASPVDRDAYAAGTASYNRSIRWFGGYAFFSGGDTLPRHDDKGSEADGTLVVKAFAQANDEMSF